MKRIAVESPYSGDIAHNVRYLAWCVKHVYDCGHAAYAGHGTGPCAYPEHGRYREHGLAADIAFAQQCDEVWFFVDLGWSSGMTNCYQSFANFERTRLRACNLPPKDFAAFELGEWPPGATLRWVPRSP